MEVRIPLETPRISTGQPRISSAVSTSSGRARDLIASPEQSVNGLVRRCLWYAAKGVVIGPGVSGGFHSRPGISSPGWTQPANDKRSNLRYSIKVTVDVHDTHPMMERSLGDEKVWDRRPVPHTMVMCEILLEPQRSIEDVRRCRGDLEVRT